MCIDANAGARAAARQRAREKDSVFKQKALQFFNKETTLERTLQRNVLGYSRDVSDAYTRANKLLGKSRKAKENVVAKYYKKTRCLSRFTATAKSTRKQGRTNLR